MGGDASPCEEIDIGIFDQLVWLDVKFLHEFARILNASIRRFIVNPHELELKKIPQLLDFVDMNARSSYQE
jgi:hypothetical protein